MTRPQNHHLTTVAAKSSTITTRDLPNLTECHACGFRIDTCTRNPSNNSSRIQTLDSEWRVILLCTKCTSRVESSIICSYCFKESSDDTNCFRCRQCRRSVHRTCFQRHKFSPPWSFSGPDFTVCVDCWIPKPLLSSKVRVLRGDCTEIANYRDLEAKRKRAAVASRALDMVVVEAKNRNKKEVDEDAQLAFRLHRAMNSSPRILSNLLSTVVNSDVPSETSNTSNVGEDCLKPKKITIGKVYLRRRLKDGKNCATCSWLQMNEGEREAEGEAEETCSNKLKESNSDDNGMHSQLKSCRDGDFDRYMFKYRKRKSSTKGMGNIESNVSCQGFPVKCQDSAEQCITLSNDALLPFDLSGQGSASCDGS
ncbi:hypothetical protein CFOL_v3_24603 [Cephalotus follicularis]|uniref:Uncharacterized protein n=1 Tax=Cephalotus follicularis TaxID=3775 RepID=A0A1Q3CLL7_CEPFO|nr:hypothetical protein CFOL_v3_24603 [Cephalotus follicularis]